jgi:hydrogenase maturation protein HypF
VSLFDGQLKKKRSYSLNEIGQLNIFGCLQDLVGSNLEGWRVMRLRVKVTGIVQGVGFRPFVYRMAVENQLCGYVKNRGDAGVEILVEGSEKSVKSFLNDLKKKKPSLAQIYNIATSELGGKSEYDKFTIHKSSNETELSGSVIPPDIAICNDCLRELRDPKDSRYEYFFITCTNCGPRFTIIEKLPYDRENTTMREFPMCGFCLSEFKDPLNRRFHAQTVACPKCGPKVYLTNAENEKIECRDPVREAGKLLSEGQILAIKGYGGFHVAASTVEDGPLTRLRRVKHRSQKPFATMARTLNAIRTFADVSEEEAEILTSYTRPIVLLNKNKNYYLSELIAPGLHNVGVMLPYTALHYMLFDQVSDSAFVMTSANPPNQPIINDDNQASKTLSDTVDYFLFHNRKIAHRCDDSVMRMHGGNALFIRRSRGYAPAPVVIKESAKQCVLGLGGELNDTACVLNGNKAFISQHVGDVENIETKSFLESASRHLIRLTNSKIEIVACDLHPKFTTTQLAHELAEKKGWQLTQIQHHYAHVAALMLEHGVDEILGVCCDGYGYGVDGEAWGGEIIFSTRDAGGFRRLAHLEKQPLIGGDLATRYPLRMAAGMLCGRAELEDWLMKNKQHFPHGETEIQLIIQQLEKRKNIVQTTSCGRVLDAVSAILGVCYERTYEGEPSMKLESAAIEGKDVLKLKPMIESNTLKTTQMLQQIFENREKYSRQDLAKSAHVYMATGLATLAMEKAEEKRVGAIGFSGGVACNKIITLTMRKIVEASGFRFLVHQAVPPGDGGLSFGQAVASGFFQF